MSRRSGIRFADKDMRQQENLRLIPHMGSLSDPMCGMRCSLGVSAMIAIFAPSDSALKKSGPIDLEALPQNAVWIDLDKPTAEEDRAVERLAGIAVPTREDMQEIEISSRLYTENGARYMTATLMCAA